MPIDTRSKRASSVGILLPFVLAPPLPDGTISQGDRQHAAWSYSGILSIAVTVVGLNLITWYSDWIDLLSLYADEMNLISYYNDEIDVEAGYP